jgi:hypothetical protein
MSFTGCLWHERKHKHSKMLKEEIVKLVTLTCATGQEF